MQMAELMSRKAVGMGREAAEFAVNYVRDLRWSDVKKSMRNKPVQSLIALTAVGFFAGFLAGRR